MHSVVVSDPYYTRNYENHGAILRRRTDSEQRGGRQCSKEGSAACAYERGATGVEGNEMAVEGRRGESRRRGRYDHDGRPAGSRGTTSPYRHRNTDYEGRARWGRAGRPTAQCCPTSTAELNVSRHTTTWRWPADSARRVSLRVSPGVFFTYGFYFFYTFLLLSFNDGRPEYYTDIGYTGRRQTPPPPQPLDKKNEL